MLNVSSLHNYSWIDRMSFFLLFEKFIQIIPAAFVYDDDDDDLSYDAMNC